MCLLLTSGVDPVGGYEDANNPALDENPIAMIEATATSIGFTLDADRTVETTRTPGWWDANPVRGRRVPRTSGSGDGGAPAR